MSESNPAGVTVTTTTPLFDAVAGQHREYLLGLLASRPPTAGQIIAAADAAAEGDGEEGSDG